MDFLEEGTLKTEAARVVSVGESLAEVVERVPQYINTTKDMVARFTDIDAIGAFVNASFGQLLELGQGALMGQLDAFLERGKAYVDELLTVALTFARDVVGQLMSKADHCSAKSAPF